jgi:hypothetical protein
MTDLSLPPSGRTTRIPRAALRHYGAGANPRPAILLTPHYRSAVGARGEGGKRRVIYKGIKEGLESLPHISKAKGRVLLVRCPPCPCYGWHHPSHDPYGRWGCYSESLACVAPTLSLGAQLTLEGRLDCSRGCCQSAHVSERFILRVPREVWR